MATSPFMFIFLCLQICVNSEIYPETSTNTFNPHTSEITAILNHLNSSSFKVYDYKEATLLHAHTKADITELTLTVNVECINKYPDIPCTENVLTCHAFVRSAPEGSQVLNDVNCKPKPEIVVEEASYEPPTGPPEINEAKSVALSNEAVSSEVNEPFVAVRKSVMPCLGCPFEVNPDAEGVDELVDLALEHVGSERENKQGLVKVLKVQQQVVSGVKYILVAELGPTICSKLSTPDVTSCPLDPNSETAICEITYLQKPWISKSKHIISNNCTTSQEYVREDDKKSELSNEIDISGTPSKPPLSTPNFDHIAESGNLEMSPSRLTDLESQILLDIEEPIPSKESVPEAVAPSVASVPVIEERFEIDPTSAVEEVADGENTTPQVVTEIIEDKVVTEITEDKVVTERVETKSKEQDSSEESKSSSEEDTRSKRSEESAESDETTKSTISELKTPNNSSEESAESAESTSNSTTSDIKNDSSEETVETTEPPQNPARKRRAIPQLEKISPDEKPLVKNLADFAAAALDNIDDDNHKRIILQILGAKKMVGDDGVYYHLIMRMGISRCLEDKPPNPYENCRDKLFENYTKICKVQVYVNDDFTTPKVVKSQCQNIKRDKNDSNRTNYSRFRRSGTSRGHIAGGLNEIDKDSERVTSLLREGLGHLNAQRNTNKHKSVEVISATSQVVAGSMVRIKTRIAETDCSKNDGKDLEDCNVRSGASPRECLIKVWEKPWQNFKKFTITCEGDEKTYEAQAASRDKRQLRIRRSVGNSEEHVRGGQSEIDKNSARVTTLLREGLNHLNSKRNTNKHKSIEVISATDQVVAGSLLRIRTKIAETDCSKNDGKDLQSCNVRSGATPKECLIEVWEKPWENFKRFTITCEGDERKYEIQTTSRSKRSVGNNDEEQLVGGESAIDKNSARVTKLLREGLNHLNARRDTNKHKSVEVVSVTKQVVAGSLLRITTKIAETDCSKNDGKDLEDCNVRSGATPKKCLIKVWEKPWLNFKKFTITCEGDEKTYEIQTTSRSKRQATGGEYVVSAGDERLLDEYLEDSLSQLDAQSYQENKYKVDEILSINKQVVAGHVYRIKAKVILTDCKKSLTSERRTCNTQDGAQPKLCSFKIFEALWIPNSRQITISCDDVKPEPLFDYPRNTELLGNDDPKVHFELFNHFIEKYDKKYTKKEFKYRFKVFSDNLYHIRLLNRYEQGTATYGITQFTDMTQLEFSKSRGLRTDLRNENEPPLAKAQIPDVDIPAEFDWRKKGAVTEVKNQEQCGSCWAFSVTGNVEGQYAIRHGKLMEFSEQELVDCDKEDQGCNGGLMDTAYRQIEKLGGLETEQDYPYDAEDETCHFNRTLARVQLSGAVNISHDEGDMAKWLVANGPISIAINANAMQFYFGGISHPFKFLCSPKNLDHGVLIVGYGVHTYPLFNKTLPYWIVKNSWGTSWGEQGYYRVYRGDGTCGLNQTPSSAIVV